MTMYGSDSPFGCCGAYNDPTCTNGCNTGYADQLGRYAECKWIDGKCDKEGSTHCPCRMCGGRASLVNCETCCEEECVEVSNAINRR